MCLGNSSVHFGLDTGVAGPTSSGIARHLAILAALCPATWACENVASSQTNAARQHVTNGIFLFNCIQISSSLQCCSYKKLGGNVVQEIAVVGRGTAEPDQVRHHTGFRRRW